jgi:hypothetical protein
MLFLVNGQKNFALVPKKCTISEAIPLKGQFFDQMISANIIYFVYKKSKFFLFLTGRTIHGRIRTTYITIQYEQVLVPGAGAVGAGVNKPAAIDK